MGLLDVQAASPWRFQPRPWLVPVPSPLRPSQAGAAQDPGKRLFWILSPHRREGAPEAHGGAGPRRRSQGPRHPGDCGESPLTGSPGPGGGAAPLQRSAASCGPARSRWRRQDAGRRRGPEGRAAGLRWAGPPPRLQGAGRGGLRARRWGVPGARGPQPLLSTSTPPLSGPDPRSAGSFACR